MIKIIEHDFSGDLEGIEIYPLTDLHIGDPHTDLKLFEEFKEHVLASPNRYILLVGDLINNATKSSVSNVYRETMSPGEQKKYVINELMPLKDRILSITGGNHEARSAKEVDNDISEDIAMMLGLQHLYQSEGSFLKLNIGRAKNGGKINYILHATHGASGGSGVSGALNRLETYGVNYEGVDVFVQGHVHAKAAAKGSKIVIDVRHGTAKQKDVLYVIAAAWQEYGGYGMKAMYKPRPKGMTPIYLNGLKKEMRCDI